MAEVIDQQVVNARRALLDAFEALGVHRESIVLVGAQAVYLHTGSAEIAIAEFTTDGDLVVDSRTLVDDPLVELAMEAGGFMHDPSTQNPGVWLSRDGVQVDLMVPAAIAGVGRRSVEAPPHGKLSMRKSYGLEAALVSNVEMEITSFEASDERTFAVRVAGPAALLVAKLHKLHERITEKRGVENKDAHDIYRLLVALDTDLLVKEVSELLGNEMSAEVSREALQYLGELFADGPEAAGSEMAGAAEIGVGNPSQVSESVSLLADDLRKALESIQPDGG